MPDPSLRDLDWQPVILVSLCDLLSLRALHELSVSRLYLALHPDGVVCAAWDVLPENRVFPQVQLVGWKPQRDGPFELPTRFVRKGAAHVAALIPNGTWVLPYQACTYHLFTELATAHQQVRSEDSHDVGRTGR